MRPLSSTLIAHSPRLFRRHARRLFIFTIYSSLLTCLVATAAHEAPINPDDPAYLRRQYAWFQSQDAARQQQIRKLHAEFLQQDPDTQAKLTRVMQSYNAWLAQLDPADRERVLSAPSAQARLLIVHELRERDWVQTLARPEREEYKRLAEDARRQKVKEWRAEEAERRDEWALAQRHWAENPPGKIPPMFQNDGRAQVEVFVNHLRENLNEVERRELDEARTAVDEYGNFVWYALDVVRLADRHPLLPYRKPGPKDYESIPEAMKRYLVQNDSHFRKKGPLATTDEMRVMRRASGRWPEYAAELMTYCQKKGLKPPGLPLGDCRKDQMPPEVVQFIDKNLTPRLRQTEAGRTELEALNKAQGAWPEYPRMLMDLAKKYKLAIPGWTLPGPQGAWDRFRGIKLRPK